MDESDSRKKFCPPPSVASQLAKAQIIKESDTSSELHTLTEIIVAKLDPKDIPSTPEQIELWVRQKSIPPEKWKEKKFILPDASNPYM